jgi:hypothetical protein
MPCIILMHNKQFFKFVEKFDPLNYMFIVISEDIPVDNTFDSLIRLSKLKPPYSYTTLVKEDFGEISQEAADIYIRYISKNENLTLICTAIQYILESNISLVFLCSETEYNYLGNIFVLADYIENVFKVPNYTYKEYVKNPDKAERSTDMKQLDICYRTIREELGTFDSVERNKQLKKDLKKFNRKELLLFAKENQIFISDTNMDKSDIIKAIMKKMER